MTRSLTAESIQVVTAADGEAGLALARELKPALIFLDVLMPRMDGWAVLTALKAEPDLVDTPVVMLSIMNETEMGYVLGAVEYLTKPLDRQRLVAVLQKYQVAEHGADLLVVEDDAATRRLVQRTLGRHGWTIAEAENGRTALAWLERHRPALILLDLMMPEMDGFEFLQELRHARHGSRFPWWCSRPKIYPRRNAACSWVKLRRSFKKGLTAGRPCSASCGVSWHATPTTLQPPRKSRSGHTR